MLSRRRLFFGSLALPAFAQTQTPAAERPNILLIVVDQLPTWVLGSYGATEFRTPNLDRLIQTGTRLRNHMVATPAPGPSRATLMTGRTPMQLGEGGTVSPSDITVEKLLAGLGYACYATPAMPSSGVTAEAMKFIDAQAAGKPFLLTAGYADLRPPYEGVPQKFAGMFANTKFETAGYEPAAANAREGKEMLADAVAGLRKYAAALAAMDDDIGTLLSRLQQRKLTDSTLIVFTGSCGALLGRHGLWDAGDASDPVNMYMDVMETPLVWSWPGHVPPQGMRPDLVSPYDFLPTICRLTRIDLPKRNLCGRSYLNAVTGRLPGKGEVWRTNIFGHYRNTDTAREDRYKLVLRDEKKGPNELYDLKTDPRESVNQYANEQFQSVRTSLTAALEEWKQRYSV